MANIKEVTILPQSLKRQHPWWEGLDGKIRRGDPIQIPKGVIKAQGVQHHSGREDVTVKQIQVVRGTIPKGDPRWQTLTKRYGKPQKQPQQNSSEQRQRRKKILIAKRYAVKR